MNFQRKSAVLKEPKVFTETEIQEEQQKENSVNEQGNEKLSTETTNKQVPDPSSPENVEEAFTAERLFEYQWPPDRSGEYYLLQHQVCQFLETEDLEERNPGERFWLFMC